MRNATEVRRKKNHHPDVITTDLVLDLKVAALRAVEAPRLKVFNVKRDQKNANARIVMYKTTDQSRVLNTTSPKHVNNLIRSRLSTSFILSC